MYQKPSPLRSVGRLSRPTATGFICSKTTSGCWVLLGEPERSAKLAGELRRLTREQRQLWLVRSRPGGLDDSLAYFGAALADYAPVPG